MKLGAIDIGSNAARLLIAETRVNGDMIDFKKLQLIRVPLRLGETVFTEGIITPKKQKQLSKSMAAFKYLMEVYDVEAYSAYATSAMREAKNGKKIVASILEKNGINIELISGQKEATLIRSTFKNQEGIDFSQNYLYIDVGGGSTEISFLKNGTLKKSKSFAIGTVRLLNNKVNPEVWDEMKDWLKANKHELQNITGIGTGGNINRLVKISDYQTKGRNRSMGYDKLQDITQKLSDLSLEERILKYRLKRDRADVIVHAAEIYLHALKHADINEIIVPKIGLADGMIYELFKEVS